MLRTLVLVLAVLGTSSCHDGRKETLVILGDSTAGHLQDSPHGVDSLKALQQKFRTVRFVEIPPGNKSLHMYAQLAPGLDLNGDILLVLAGGHDVLYNKEDGSAYADALKAEYLRQRKGQPAHFIWFDTSQLNKWDSAMRVDEWHLNANGYVELGMVVGLW